VDRHERGRHAWRHRMRRFHRGGRGRAVRRRRARRRHRRHPDGRVFAILQSQLAPLLFRAVGATRKRCGPDVVAATTMVRR
jgi:hypothetical protein